MGCFVLYPRTSVFFYARLPCVLRIKIRPKSRGMGDEPRSVLPLEKMYDFLSRDAAVTIWEKDPSNRHCGRIVGFDEYMNVVVDGEAGRYLLKGDCICAIFETGGR